MNKNDTKEVKTVKKAKKNGKPNIFVRFWKKIKEVFSELKKVTWPSFGKVVKQTCVVLVVVLIFLVAITLIDWLLAWLLEMLTGANLG